MLVTAGLEFFLVFFVDIIVPFFVILRLVFLCFGLLFVVLLCAIVIILVCVLYTMLGTLFVCLFVFFLVRRRWAARRRPCTISLKVVVIPCRCRFFSFFFLFLFCPVLPAVLPVHVVALGGVLFPFLCYLVSCYPCLEKRRRTCTGSYYITGGHR